MVCKQAIRGVFSIGAAKWSARNRAVRVIGVESELAGARVSRSGGFRRDSGELPSAGGCDRAPKAAPGGEQQAGRRLRDDTEAAGRCIRNCPAPIKALVRAIIVGRRRRS